MLKSLLLGFTHKQNVQVKLRRRYQMNVIKEANHDKFLEDFSKM